MSTKALVKHYSLNKRLILFLSLVLSFLISLILAVNFFAFYQFNASIVASNQRTLDYSRSQIERRLTEIDDMMVSTSASSPNFTSLMRGINPLQAHLASHELINRLKDVSGAYTALDAVFIYSEGSQSYRDSFRLDLPYEEKDSIRSWLREVVRIDRFTYSDGWITRNIGGTPYVMHFYGGRGTYLVALSSFETLGDVGFFSDQAIHLGFDSPAGSNTPSNSNKDDALILSDQIPNSDITMHLYIPNSGYLYGLSPLHWTLLIASLTSILLIPLVLSWLKRNVLQPLSSIKHTIEAIRSGDMAVRSPDSHVEEFQAVNETFNEMMSEIRDLRIDRYERTIEAQQAQLQYLKLQIRPHFYLNYLKGLYAIAGQGEGQRTQSMILAISGHLRYIFRDQLDLVSLEEELNHIKNYILIQQNFSALKPKLTLDIEASLHHYSIPPLTLSTFVENSIQHQSEEIVEIEVSAKVIEDLEQSFLQLSVKDNGKGFSSEVLKDINQDGPTSVYTSAHVGIKNVRHRFKMIYGDDVVLAFYNTASGPVSEVYIPLDLVKGDAS